MQISDTRTFEKGLDLDSSPLVIENGKYRDALNIYNGRMQSGDVGTIRREKGNVLVPDTLPSGVNTCIGTCEDIETDSIITFIHNSLGEHSIRRYSSSGATVEVIAQGAILNFQLSSKIRGADVLEGLLYWTDGYFDTYAISNGIEGYNPPRKINISKALNGGYSSIDQQTLDRIKWPPSTAPSLNFRTDETNASNFLYGFLFQFRYRYIYDDYERSVWSPISVSEIPPSIELVDGRNADDPTRDNTIDVTVNSGHHTVRAIEVAARIGNGRPFGVFKTLDKEVADNTDIVVSFTNNQSGRALSTEENGKNYDRVPQVSKDQELVEGNRLVDANIVEGYDTVPISRKSVEFDNSTTFTTAGYDRRRPEVNQVAEFNVTQDLFLGVVSDIVAMPSYELFKEGDVVEMNIGGSVYSTTISPAPGSTSNLINQLATTLAQNGITAVTTGSLMVFPLNDVISFTHVPIAPFFRRKSLKSGAYHPVGFVYKDRAGRPCSVITGDSLNLYVPFATEGSSGLQNQLYSTASVQYRLNLNIVHQPPEWATHYDIVMRRNTRLISFGQWSVRRSALSSTGRLELYLDTHYEGEYEGTGIKHQVQVGDVVRFISDGSDDPVDQSFLGKYQECRVTEVFDDINAIEVDVRQSLIDFTGANWGALIEIYTPRKEVDESEDIWYEIGQTHPIINPHTENRHHGVNESSVADSSLFEFTTNLNTGAALDSPVYRTDITIETGDVYVRTRNMFDYSLDEDGTNDIVRTYWVEDPHLSDYFESDWHDWGRVHTLDPFARRQELKTGLRYSEILNQNTRVNGLSSVDDASFESVRDIHGEIQRIIEVGYVLKVLQNQKMTSIYLSRSVLFNSDGSSNISSSEQVLGTKNPSDTAYGTIHPDSVVKSDRYLYFYDAMNGCVVRDASNGPQTISSKGLDNFFSEQSDFYRSIGDVVAGVDKDSDRYVITLFYNGQVRPAPETVTLSYSEFYDFWICKHSYVPEMYGRRGMNMYSFKDGQMWIHNRGDETSFYGVEYESSVTPVFNQDPRKVKVAHAISTESDDVWHSESDGDVSTLSAHEHTQDITRILGSRYDKIEGGYYTDMPFALNTPGVTDPIVNGRDIRGRAIQIKLRNSSEQGVYLFGVTLTYSNSE